MDISKLPPQLDPIAAGVSRQAPRQPNAVVRASIGSSGGNQLAAQAQASSRTELGTSIRAATRSPNVARGSIVNIVV